MRTLEEILAAIEAGEAVSLDELSAALDEAENLLIDAARAKDLEVVQSLGAARATLKSTIEATEAADAEVEAQIAELLDGLDIEDAGEDAEAEGTETEDAEAEAGGADAEAEAEDLELVAAAPRLSLTDAVARLQSRTRTAADEAPAATSGYSVTTADGTVDANGFDFTTAAREFNRRQAHIKGGRDRLIRIEHQLPGEYNLQGLDADAATARIESIMSPEAVMAAGGCCSIAEPISGESAVTSSTARPLRDSIPGFTGSKVVFYPPVCDAEGVTIWTCDDDEAVDPDDEATWKPCPPTPCPPEIEAVADAILFCRTIGNWQRRFATGQWEQILRKLRSEQARVAEVNLFDKAMDQVTTTHQVANDGGFISTFFDGIGRAASQIRQEERLDQSVQLVLWAPEWLRAALRSDGFRWGPGDGIKGLNDAQIANWLGQYGVRAVYSPDIDPIFPDSPGQVDGPLAEFPALANTVLFHEGAFAFMDAGTFDLGTEIQDVANIRQNQVTAFTESFEGLIARTCNAKALQFEVVTSGSCCPGVGSV